jgi:hypothetical protein
VLNKPNCCESQMRHAKRRFNHGDVSLNQKQVAIKKVDIPMFRVLNTGRRLKMSFRSTPVVVDPHCEKQDSRRLGSRPSRIAPPRQRRDDDQHRPRKNCGRFEELGDADNDVLCCLQHASSRLKFLSPNLRNSSDREIQSWIRSPTTRAPVLREARRGKCSARIGSERSCGCARSDRGDRRIAHV